MLYVWIGLGIVLLVVITKLVKAWNEPKVSADHAKEVEAKAKLREAALAERTERKRIQAESRSKRRERFFARKNKKGQGL